MCIDPTTVTPSEFIQYVALEQLDALAIEGVSRAMSGFANIAKEADAYGNRMFESYGQAIGEGHLGDLADEARDQAVRYYQLLDGVRQAMLNLLAAGLYHLYEQHRDMLREILRERGSELPALENLPGSTTIDELRLVANTVKHAHGPSATQLRAIRPDLFAPRVARGSPIEKHVLRRPVKNPLGGTDLFVSEADIQSYRDGIRELWESLRALV